MTPEKLGLGMLGFGLALGLAGCGSDAEKAEIKRPADALAKSAREACEFKAGALPKDTLGKSDPIGKSIPIEHVIVLMMENRSFDHYFSKLPAYGQTDVDVADDSFANQDTTGTSVKRFHATEYCVEDPEHGWRAVHEQFNGGKNDGFVLSNEPGGARAMGYFDQTDIPFYYELANTFAISDTYHSSLLGPTWPNRMYLYGGSSNGYVQNKLPAVEVPNLFQAMNDAGVDWREYNSTLAPPAMYATTWFPSMIGCGKDDPELPCHGRSILQLLADLEAGDLPPVTFIDPEYEKGIVENSEHPPGNMQYGQHFVWTIVTALQKSPLWKNSVLFLTYDEHGGFADHVPPPPACDPGTGAPQQDADLGTFDRYGIRVPVFAISPYAKKHFVSHVTHDHTSILRFIEAKFGLPAISNRDANADAMMDLFDFDSAQFAEPPTFDEPATDPAKVSACEAAFPGG